MFSISDMDVDQVHDMMDEIAEQQEVAKEIGKFIFNYLKDLKEIITKLFQKLTLEQLFLGDAISNPTAFSSEFDDDELEAELEALELEAQTDEQVMLIKFIRFDLIYSKVLYLSNNCFELWRNLVKCLKKLSNTLILSFDVLNYKKNVFSSRLIFFADFFSSNDELTFKLRN